MLRHGRPAIARSAVAAGVVDFGPGFQRHRLPGVSHLGRGSRLAQGAGQGRIRRVRGRAERRSARPGQQLAARFGSQRGREQQGVATQGHVVAQHLRQHLAHESIGGVYFIDHQQAARQGGGPQMGVLALQTGHQHLVDRAHRHPGGKEALGAFSGPAAVAGVAIRP